MIAKIFGNLIFTVITITVPTVGGVCYHLYADDQKTLAHEQLSLKVLMQPANKVKQQNKKPAKSAPAVRHRGSSGSGSSGRPSSTSSSTTSSSASSSSSVSSGSSSSSSSRTSSSASSSSSSSSSTIGSRTPINTHTAGTASTKTSAGSGGSTKKLQTKPTPSPTPKPKVKVPSTPPKIPVTTTSSSATTNTRKKTKNRTIDIQTLQLIIQNDPAYSTKKSHWDNTIKALQSLPTQKQQELLSSFTTS